jgi:hypothetical protein
MMDVNRNCPATPSSDELKPPIFTPRERTSSGADSNCNIYALNLTHIPEVQTPITDLSFSEQLRLERDIAHQSSVVTRDSFRTTYSSLQTMLSQMQLKVAAAFLQETEYLQQREQRLEYEEQFLTERQKQLDNIRQQRERMEEDFLQIKERLEAAVRHISKFKTDGVNPFLSFSLVVRSHWDILDGKAPEFVCRITTDRRATLRFDLRVYGIAGTFSIGRQC